MSITETDTPAAPTPAPAAKLPRKKKRTARGDELSGRPKIKEKLGKLFESVAKGFKDQADRADAIMDYWDLYNCVLGRNQNYNGNLCQIFVPIVKDAVEALATRYINQAFPQSGRHVEAVTGESDQPYALLSLIEHYIDASKLRTQSVRALLVNGQVEGQYNAYIRWDKIERWAVSRETKPMKVLGRELPGTEDVEAVVEEKITDEMPVLEVLHDTDVLVLPATAESIEDALESGGSVTVLRRWTKGQVEDKVDEGEFDEDVADDIMEAMGGYEATQQNAPKKIASAAGIHISGTSSFVVGYETWTKLDVDGRKRLCRAYYGGDKQILGCKLNPYWNDRCPVKSAPVKKLPGVFKGEAPVAAAKDMQIAANDLACQAGDMMYYTMAPVLTVDPERVSKWKELVADVAAVWPVHPDGVKMLEWPNKFREAMEGVATHKAMIFETLGVNPGMLPQQTGKPGAKRNQAEVALEQQVDLLTTADAVTVLEQEILTPYVQTAAEYDHQFRDTSILVREFGELGLRAGMERIEPIQMGKRWQIRWSGVEAARNAANIQQQIAWLNVVKTIPPQQYMGYRLDVAPVLEQSAGQVFGARLGRLVFRSMRDENTVPPDVENGMLDQGFEVQTHAADNDPEHLQMHMQGMQQATPDARQAYEVHIRMHQTAMALKQAAMAQQGAPGGGGPSARPGAQAGPPKPVQGPPGMIHRDRMPAAGAMTMPRKM